MKLKKVFKIYKITEDGLLKHPKSSIHSFEYCDFFYSEEMAIEFCEKEKISNVMILPILSKSF